MIAKNVSQNIIYIMDNVYGNAQLVIIKKMGIAYNVHQLVVLVLIALIVYHVPMDSS